MAHAFVHVQTTVRRAHVRYKAVPLVWVALLAGSAAAMAAPREDAVNEIIELSTLAEQFEDIAERVQAAVEQRANQTDERLQRAAHILNGSFSAQRMRAAAAASLRGDYDEAKFAAWRDRLRSPLAEKMARLERQPTASASQLARRTHAPEMQSPAPGRIELVGRLIDATGTAEMMVITQLGIAEAFMRSSIAALPNDERPSEEQFQGLLAKMHEQAMPAARAFLISKWQQAHQAVSEEELLDHVQWYESPVGRWSTPVLIRALKAAFLSAFEKVDSRW